MINNKSYSPLGPEKKPKYNKRSNCTPLSIQSRNLFLIVVPSLIPLLYYCIILYRYLIRNQYNETNAQQVAAPSIHTCNYYSIDGAIDFLNIKYASYLLVLPSVSPYNYSIFLQKPSLFLT